MKALFFLITLTLLGCGTDQGEFTTYNYTVRNETGVLIKVSAYNTLSATPSEIIYSTTLENGNEIKKTFEDGLPPKPYTFSDFFGNPNGRSVADSIQIIFNNQKFVSYNNKSCGGGIRNPLNLCIYNNENETFIFTKEDYENAEPCNDSCE